MSTIDARLRSRLRATDVLLPGQTMWFLGDSVSVQHERAFACRLHDELAARTGRSVRLQVQPELRLAHNQSVNPQGRWCARTHCVQVEAWRTCYVQAGGMCFWHDDVHAMATRLVNAKSKLGERVVRRGDVIVVNEGLHLHKCCSLSAQLDRLRGFALLREPNSTLGLAARRGIRFLWRETSPQHFAGSPDGHYNATTRRCTRHKCKYNRCAPLEQPARSAHADQTLQLMATAGLPVVRIWEPTVAQWSEHVELRSPYASTRDSIDCTHFCEPSVAVEAWNDATLEALKP